jgi:hypothetical protein
MARLWYWQASLRRAQGTRYVLAVQMVVMAQLLCQRLAPDWSEAYARVGHILAYTVRASSAVECMDRVLRMYQARHRHVSQGMLDLKRVFWNCRPFTHGKRRGACPYQLLGLHL